MNINTKEINIIQPGTAKAGRLSIEEVNDVTRFRSMKNTWNALLRDSGDNNVFLTWEWIFTWWRHYGNNHKLRILLIKEDNKIIGIAPFMQRRYRKGIFKIDVLENICAEECDYSGVILTEKMDESISILLDYLENILRNSNILIRISQVPEDSIFLKYIRQQYPFREHNLSIHEQVITSCPYIDNLGTWEEYTRSLHKHGRYKVNKLKREIQNLQESKQFELKQYTDSENLDEQLEMLFNLHQKRWQHSKFFRPEVREFYRDISKAFYKNNWMDFSFVNIEGKIISASWGFVYNKQFYYMTSAYDPGSTIYNPGHMLTMQLIERAIKNGLGKFDFLKGDEFFKSYWTHEKLDNMSIMLSKKGIKGSWRVALFRYITKLGNIQERSIRDNLSLLLKKVKNSGKPAAK